MKDSIVPSSAPCPPELPMLAARGAGETAEAEEWSPQARTAHPSVAPRYASPMVPRKRRRTRKPRLFTVAFRQFGTFARLVGDIFRSRKVAHSGTEDLLEEPAIPVVPRAEVPPPMPAAASIQLRPSTPPPLTFTRRPRERFLR